MKTKTLSLILALSLTLSTSFTFAVGLSVTVSTDKANYQASEKVNISGKVLADSTPAVDALVGILVKDSDGTPIISRSVKTQADGSFNLNFVLPSVAKGGSYTVQATASYQGQTASAETTFTVKLPPQDFSISTSPSALSIDQGESTTYLVTVESINNFNSSVSLILSGLPTGASYEFDPTPATPPANGSSQSKLRITTTPTVANGTFRLTVTGTSGSLSHSHEVTLTINLKAKPAQELSIVDAALLIVIIVAGAVAVLLLIKRI